MTLRLESGDWMDNLMVLIMSVVRKMTGSDQKMGVSSATNVLKSLNGFANVKDGNYDLNNLSGCKIVLIDKNAKTNSAIVTAASNHVPFDGFWWLVIQIESDINGERKFQICMPDNGKPCLYMRRCNTDYSWTAWTILGGRVINLPLVAYASERRCAA